MKTVEAQEVLSWGRGRLDRVSCRGLDARRQLKSHSQLSTLNSHLFYRNNSNQKNSVISFISLFEKNLKTDKVGKFVKIRLRFAKSTLSISYSLKFDRFVVEKNRCRKNNSLSKKNRCRKQIRCRKINSM